LDKNSIKIKKMVEEINRMKIYDPFNGTKISSKYNNLFVYIFANAKRMEIIMQLVLQAILLFFFMF